MSIFEMYYKLINYVFYPLLRVNKETVEQWDQVDLVEVLENQDQPVTLETKETL